MELLSIIVSLWGPVKSLFQWARQKAWKPRQRKAEDFVLTRPQLTPDQQHYRLITHYAKQLRKRQLKASASLR